MRHPSRTHRCLLLAMAMLGCNVGDTTNPRPQPIAFAPFLGMWDVVDVPMRVDSSAAGVQDIVAEELAITEQRSWWVIRTDRYILNGDTTLVSRKVLEGTWAPQEASLLLSTGTGALRVTLSGDVLTMTEDCASLEACFASAVILRWNRRQAVP